MQKSAPVGPHIYSGSGNLAHPLPKSYVGVPVSHGRYFGTILLSLIGDYQVE